MSLTTITTKYAHAGAEDNPEAARSCVDVFGRNKVDVTRMLIIWAYGIPTNSNCVDGLIGQGMLSYLGTQ
jgi:hypothetical protein